MRDLHQRSVADVAREFRETLDLTRRRLGELDDSGDAANPVIKRLVALEERLLNLEDALLDDLDVRAASPDQVCPPGPPPGVRHRVAARARGVVTARLGTLYHHRPIPLKLPTSYFSTDPPDPAPTISIVTPSFGQGQYIERTLYSVVNQNYPALEYVVQDGGSTDDTVEILRRYAPNFAYWASEPDEGQADALSRGFSHTTGEIMAYLNSDDLLLPGSLAYVGRYFVEHPDVDVIYGHRVIIDAHDRQVGTWIMPAHDDDELALIDYVPQETLFWRRSAWVKAGGKIDTSLQYAIDWDLLLRLRESGARMVRVPRLIGAFRVHDEQKTTAWHQIGLAECDALRRRVHQRAVSHDEAAARTAPYLRRHVAQHLWERVKLPFAGPRALVRTEPLEPHNRRVSGQEHQIG